MVEAFVQIQIWVMQIMCGTWLSKYWGHMISFILEAEWVFGGAWKDSIWAFEESRLICSIRKIYSGEMCSSV